MNYVASVQEELSQGIFRADHDIGFRPGSGLVMDSFGCCLCAQCEEENFFMDGSRCARCLGLELPLEDEDNEEPSSFALEELTAA
jgi:hypothetical protein